MSPIQFVVTKIGDQDNSNDNLLVSDEWLSESHAIFPIDIEIVLRRKSNVEKLLVTSHHTFIPARMQLFSLEHEGEEPKTLGEVQFKPKGPKDKHEMKTIFVDVNCSKLLLRVHESHPSLDNTEYQVGLVQVKVFGKYTPGQQDHWLFRRREEQQTKEKPDGKYTREMEELGALLEKNKLKAVEDENFYLAKQAQMASRMMIKAKKEMSELERDMNEALEMEDYQRAHDLRDEMKTLRANVLSTVDQKLVEEVPNDPSSEPSVSNSSSLAVTPSNDHRPANLFSFSDMDKHAKAAPPRLYTPIDLSPTRLMSPSPSVGSVSIYKVPRPRSQTPLSSSMTSPSTRPDSGTSKITRRSSSSSIITRKSTNKFLEKENMIVPAVLRESRGRRDSSELSEDQPVVEEEDFLASVHPNDRTAASRACTVFGNQVMSNLFSKRWINRRNAITEVIQRLNKNNNNVDVLDMFEASLFVVSRTLKDSLYNVYTSSLNLLTTFASYFIPDNNLYKQSHRLATATTETLMAKLADNNDKRTVTETQATLSQLLDDKKLAKAYIHQVLAITGTKLLKGRSQTIEMAVDHYDVPNDQVSLEEKKVSQFCQKCLKSSDPQVRQRGKDIFMKLYRNGDKQTLRKSMPLEASTYKHPLYRSIFAEMEAIDRQRNSPLHSILRKTVRIQEPNK